MKKNTVLVVILILSLQSVFAQTWSALPGAPSASRFDDIYFVNDSIGWAVNSNGLVYKTNVKKRSWELQLTTGTYNRSTEFLDDTTGFVGTISSAFYRTSDAGKHWVRIDQNFPVQVPAVCGMSHRGDTIFIVGSYFASPFVNRSFDRGKTWTYTDMSTLTSGLVDTWFKSKDTVFVSGNGVDGRGIVLRSVDTGNTWAEVTTPGTVPTSWGWKFHFPTPSVGYVSLEEVDISDHYLSNNTRFLKTTDGGRTWTVMDTKIGKNIDIQGIGFIDANHGWIGGNSKGMYETTDGGISWKLVNQFQNLDRFFSVNKNTTYFSGTTIFKLGPIITGVEPPPSNSKFHSLEIFPNPANQECKAKVTLYTTTMVTISLRDITGRPLKEIYRGQASEGIHNYEIGLEGLASGEYIVYLLTNEHFIGKKIIKK
ncbi:MAG: T9SS type A sorting domain-containing protein [Cyclobacteriaceae bacterium]